MKIEKTLQILILALSLISCIGSSQEKDTIIPTPDFNFSGMEKTIFPKPIGIINDYGQIFTESQRIELSKLLYDYDIKTTRQIVVVTIDSLYPYNDIQKFGMDLANEWGVGSTDKNNGLVIVLCNPLRKIGITTGIGTELILTDEVCTEVIKNTIIPELRNGKYYDGIKSGVIELIKLWK